MDSIKLLNEPDANEEDICLSERDALFLGTSFELRSTDWVRGPRIIGKISALTSVVVDEIEEHAAAADTMPRPVCRGCERT